MATPQQQLAQQVHASGRRLVVAVTGGASGALSTLLSQGGASRSILAALVPYAPQALIEFLCGQPDEFCSNRTARAMAMASFLKAQAYDPAATTRGVGSTASLASDRPKRGPHRLHVAWQSAATTAVCSLELAKGRRDRSGEEEVASALVLNAVAEACGTTARIELPLVEGERVETTRVDAPRDEQDLLAARTASIARGAAQTGVPPAAILSGAFNPIHDGHRKMMAVAQDVLGQDVALEISIENVDKPPLDFVEIDQRLRQFDASDAVWLTRAATFVKKAELFPGATFVVGADTMERIGQERYYGGPAARDAAIDAIAAAGCGFLVFGRAAEGRFRTLADLRLPPALVRLCQGVDENVFRQDVSSTQLRRKESAGQD